MVSPALPSSLPVLCWKPLYHPASFQLLGVVSAEAQQDFNFWPPGKQTPLHTGFRFLEVSWPGPVSGGSIKIPPGVGGSRLELDS